MAQRKEVFQSKVLQKLYPAAPKLDKEPNPPCIVEALANKTYVKRKARQASVGGDAGQTRSPAKPDRRVYTVLPPPADYMMHSEKSLTLCHLDNGNSAKNPSEESAHDSNDELNRDERDLAEARQGKRRKRKRRSTVHRDPVQDAAAPNSESGTGQCDAPVEHGGECMSRNRKRKLKKKRHKEKLLSMGVRLRASALEFTYQKDGEVEEEDAERRAVELSAFLRTTLDTYMSDASVHIDKRRLMPQTVETLLSSISSGCQPTSVLQQLCVLKIYVEQKDTDKLEKALKELYSNSFMSEEETSAVSSLFQYWITDILPMKEAK
ncbi:glutamate-rich protein 1 [Betta splendens]|uniref:Glutamate-rich protein 1 n=1 Tax=Betta splendens TaxID=158456 RepID=A0A6P7LNT9_BETSP|nr:glutamate-rich protein 1 [Betta splendens]